MSAFLDDMVARARTEKKTIVLPEGNDPRTLEAASKILADNVANLIILGDEEQILKSPYDLEGAKIVDVGASTLTVEITGDHGKAAALLDLLRGFGILELVRTGTVALERGRSCIEQ